MEQDGNRAIALAPLLGNLYEYTPKVSILLTKADLLDESQRGEVIAFVRAQLERNFGAAA